MITSAYAIAWLAAWIVTFATKGGGLLLALALGVVATVHALRLRRRVFAPPQPPAGP